ncbi:MAG: hypothetical protein MUC42_11720 [Bryobacter sp.]|nr:hypothetical protein [Bryobacter sp.]
MFISTLIAVVDFGQLLFTHQMLVERVRFGLRWGMINPWDGNGDKVANVILYGSPAPPVKGSTFLGLKRENLEITQAPGSGMNPNDLRMRIRVVNYAFQLYTPMISRKFTNNDAIVESTPILYRD